MHVPTQLSYSLSIWLPLILYYFEYGLLIGTPFPIKTPTIYAIYSFYLPGAFSFLFFPSLQHVPRSYLRAFVLSWNVWRLLWGVPVITCIPVHGLLGRLFKLWIKKQRNWQPCELPVKNHTWVYEAIMSSRTFGSNSWGDSVTGGKKGFFNISISSVVPVQNEYHYVISSRHC